MALEYKTATIDCTMLYELECKLEDTFIYELFPMTEEAVDFIDSLAKKSNKYTCEVKVGPYSPSFQNKTQVQLFGIRNCKLVK